MTEITNKKMKYPKSKGQQAPRFAILKNVKNIEII